MPLLCASARKKLRMFQRRTFCCFLSCPVGAVLDQRRRLWREPGTPNRGVAGRDTRSLRDRSFAAVVPYPSVRNHHSTGDSYRFAVADLIWRRRAIQAPIGNANHQAPPTQIQNRFPQSEPEPRSVSCLGFCCRRHASSRSEASDYELKPRFCAPGDAMLYPVPTCLSVPSSVLVSPRQDGCMESGVPEAVE